MQRQQTLVMTQYFVMMKKRSFIFGDAGSVVRFTLSRRKKMKKCSIVWWTRKSKTASMQYKF
jgi:hypothetical protein